MLSLRIEQVIRRQARTADAVSWRAVLVTRKAAGGGDRQRNEQGALLLQEHAMPLECGPHTEGLSASVTAASPVPGTGPHTV